MSCGNHGSFLSESMPCESQGKMESHIAAKSAMNDHAKNHVFYQAIDGQLYFLDPKQYKRTTKYPEYIFGTVKETRRCAMNKMIYPELGHIPHNVYVNIISIY